jgi:Rieske Fe-S protein
VGITRRSFVKGTLAVPVLASATGCGNDVSPAPFVDVTFDDDQTSAGYGQITVPVPRYPDLAAMGGAVMLRVAPPTGPAPPEGRPFTVPDKGILLVHRAGPDDPPEFIATRADCPHQGCPLGYSKADKLIECPCHGSRFRAVADASDMSKCVGLVLHPPAGDNLTVYKVSALGDFVTVDLNNADSCGARTDFPPVMDNKITFPLAQYPSLEQVGTPLFGKATGLADKLVVVRVAPDTVIALSAICTHLGCTIGLRTDQMRFHCPCHGSEFAYDGSVLASPAVVPLKKYDVTADATNVVVTVA